MPVSDGHFWYNECVMGAWPLFFVGLVAFTIIYAWVIGEAENRLVPIIIAITLTIAFCIGMGFLMQGFLIIGSVAGSAIGSSLAVWALATYGDEERRKRQAYYKDYCWKCFKRFDRREAKVCPKCHKHYICPHCGKCLCDKPGYDPSKDNSKVIEEKETFTVPIQVKHDHETKNEPENKNTKASRKESENEK